MSWPDNETCLVTRPTDETDPCCQTATNDDRKSKRTSLSHLVTTFNVFGGTGGSAEGGSGVGGAATISGPAVAVSNDLIADLTRQLSDLSEKFKEISSHNSRAYGVVDSGVWDTREVRAWFNLQTQTHARINFSKTFETTPTVTVSICSLDTSNLGNSRVKVFATNVDAKGFTVHADTWQDSKLFSCGVSWLAVGR